MKLDHIVVTTDLSVAAARPFADVAGLARSQGARVTLLYVVEEAPAFPRGAPLAPPVTSPDLTSRMQQARQDLETQRAHFGDVPVTVDVVASDDIAGAIADYAARNDADLIAISTHGRTGFRHLVVGSVTEALLRHSTVPVLVFPRRGEHER